MTAIMNRECGQQDGHTSYCCLNCVINQLQLDKVASGTINVPIMSVTIFLKQLTCLIHFKMCLWHRDTEVFVVLQIQLSVFRKSYIRLS